MVRNAHLSSDEIDRLLEPAHEPASRLGERLDEIQEHLETCKACQHRVDEYKAFDAKLARLRFRGRANRRSDCPDESEWLGVAGRSVSEDRVQTLVNHASGCDYCGIRLREAMEDVAQELTPEEKAVLASLESSKPEWQKRLVGTLCPKKPPRPPGMLRRAVAWTRPHLIPVMTGLAAVIALGVGIPQVVRYLSPRPPIQLLAEAYSQQRTLELRFPDAEYAPLHQEKGAAKSTLKYPTALLKAGAAIQEGLDKHPDDPAWLDARARFDLLDRNYEEAIRSLNRALEAQPDSPTLLTDLATAYFERAETENRALDYGNAIEFFGKALAHKSDDPVALFNRALTYERMFMFEQAIEDWEHYLRLDPKGGWADEARKHLKDLEQKKKAHAPGLGALLAEPAEFVRFAEGRGRAPRVSAAGEIDSRVEDYLDIAIKQWLPAAYPVGANEHSQVMNARSALRILATVTKLRHGDRWLTDMLTARPSQEFALGLLALRGAVIADEEGNPETALAQAKQAELRLKQAGNQAGELRSTLEGVYALHRSEQGEQCVAAASSLWERLQGRGYVWIEGQLVLEDSICSDKVGDLGAALAKARKAVSTTETAHYGTLHLRSLGMAASANTDAGNSAEAWALDCNGLTKYWSGYYPAMRAFQFYADLVSAAQELNQWRLALALRREAAKTIALTSNHSGEAMARYELATAAMLAGAAGEAVIELREAEQIFAELPQDKVTHTYHGYCEIAFAELEAQNGDTDDSLTRLKRLRPELDLLRDPLIQLAFYKTLGTVHLRRRQYAEAEEALGRAVHIGEGILNSLHTDEARVIWDKEAGGAYRGLVQIKLQAHKDPLGALEVWESYRGQALGPPTQDSSGVAPSAGHESSPDNLDGRSVLRSPDLVDTAMRSLEHQTVISYAQLADGLALWVFDNRGVRAEWVPIAPETLERLVRRFGAECADPRSDLGILGEDGRQLYQQLIAPVERRLEAGRTLVIEPDGAIENVPMQALEDPAGRYLGSRFTIISSPGIAYWRRLRTATDLTGRERALVMGAPAISGEIAKYFPPLPDAAREALTVASRFRSVKVLSGEQATIEAVRQELSTAVVFHFAGHAFAGGSRGGLLLAPSAVRDNEGAAILGGDDVTSALAPQLRLAVLSACSTGSGEGLVDPESLVRRFLIAGVPQVIATRWNVDSATAAEFMEAFYARLLAGSSVPGALGAAGETVRNKPQTSHPYYWAVFTAFGKG